MSKSKSIASKSDPTLSVTYKVMRARNASAERCPFCDATGIEVFEDQGTFSYSAACGACGSMGPSGETREEAVDKWNRRPVPANPLVDGVAAETLTRVSDLMTWMHWVAPPPVPDNLTEAINEEIRCGEAHIARLLHEALDYVRNQVTSN